MSKTKRQQKNVGVLVTGEATPEEIQKFTGKPKQDGNQKWQQELKEAVANGELDLADTPTAENQQHAKIYRSRRPKGKAETGVGLHTTAVLSTASVAKTTPTTVPGPTTPSKVREYTRASLRDYQNFFAAHAGFVEQARKEGFCPSLLEGLAGKKKGLYFLPLGWIPGDAVILSFFEGKVRLVGATIGAKMSLARPSPDYIPVKDLPQAVLGHLTEQQAFAEAIGREPSPWNLGFASALLRGDSPREHLTMFFPRLRFQRTDPEVPVGLSLVPDWGGLKVDRVYNPRDFPGVPPEGQIFTLEEIQRGGVGIIHKLVRTWARMEGYAKDALRHQTNHS